MSKNTDRQHARQHINPKLRRNLRLFAIIAVALFIAVVVDAVRYRAAPWQVVLGLLAGVIAGVISARMYKISWDKDAQHVTSNIDIYGVVVLVLYIGFDLTRTRLVEVFTDSNAVPAISLALLAGAMYGRVLGSGRSIMRILRDQKVFSRQHRH